jgi:hypothetical protein
MRLAIGTQPLRIPAVASTGRIGPSAAADIESRHGWRSQRSGRSALALAAGERARIAPFRAQSLTLIAGAFECLTRLVNRRGLTRVARSSIAVVRTLIGLKRCGSGALPPRGSEFNRELVEASPFVVPQRSLETRLPGRQWNVGSRRPRQEPRQRGRRAPQMLGGESEPPEPSLCLRARRGLYPRSGCG